MSEKLTAEKYFSLNPKERKKLAAVRSAERARAKRAGMPLPPTIQEELGLKTARPPKAKGQGRSQSRIKAAPQSAAEHNEKLERIRRGPDILAKAGPVPMDWRIIRGCLHARKGYDLAAYDREAKKRGLTRKLEYYQGDQLQGTIWVSPDFSEEERNKIRAVLIAVRLGATLEFREAS